MSCILDLQAKTLRLLANVYLELNEPGCYEKALNAVTLANTVGLHTHCTISHRGGQMTSKAKSVRCTSETVQQQLDSFNTLLMCVAGNLGHLKL